LHLAGRPQMSTRPRLKESHGGHQEDRALARSIEPGVKPDVTETLPNRREWPTAEIAAGGDGTENRRVLQCAPL